MCRPRIEIVGNPARSEKARLMHRAGLVVGRIVVSLSMLATSVAGPRFLYASRAEQSASSNGSKSQQHTAPREANGQTKSQDPVPVGTAMRSITLTFDYDFTKTPACSDKVKKQCVAKFSVYDISGDKPYLLFSAPVPDGAQGLVKAITATSPRMLFAVGKHRIAVSAQAPDGKESAPRDCKTIIEIKAADRGDASGTH
jgi:hypothetical protein